MKKIFNFLKKELGNLLFNISTLLLGIVMLVTPFGLTSIESTNSIMEIIVGWIMIFLTVAFFEARYVFKIFNY